MPNCSISVCHVLSEFSRKYTVLHQNKRQRENWKLLLIFAENLYVLILIADSLLYCVICSSQNILFVYVYAYYYQHIRMYHVMLLSIPVQNVCSYMCIYNYITNVCIIWSSLLSIPVQNVCSYMCIYNYITNICIIWSSCLSQLFVSVLPSPHYVCCISVLSDYQSVWEQSLLCA